MDTMQSRLSRFPSLFITTRERVSVMVGISECATEFAVCAHCSADNTSYKQEYDDASLSKFLSVDGTNQRWLMFFEAVIEAFDLEQVEVRQVAADEAVSASPDAGAAAGAPSPHVAKSAPFLEVTCQPNKGGKSFSFKLKRTTEDLQAYILSRMLTCGQTWTHPREHEQKLLRMAAETTAVRTQQDNLELEALSLKKKLICNRQLEATNMHRIAELRETLIALSAREAPVNPWDPTSRKPQQASALPSASALPNPLGKAHCKPYDLELLRLIKSRWVSLKDFDRTAPGNSVVHPYSAEELARRTTPFTNRQHEMIWQALDRIDEWDYDVSKVQTIMSGDDYATLHLQKNGGALFVTMYALLVKCGFLLKLNINEQVALNWISTVEAGYYGNPYHNSMHAADVLQVTHFLLYRGSLIQRCELSDIQVFAALLAAAVHDFGHPGINNNFHIKTRGYLATVYNDRSVLENMHVSSVFELMKDPALNILASFSEETKRDIREIMIEMVLATDMGLHSKYVAQLKQRVQQRATLLKREDQILAMANILKMADISNCGRPLEIYLRWSGKISDEFYQQGDRERNLGITCSPFMDRQQPAIAKGQIAFMTYIIIPFFELVSEILPDMRSAVMLAEANKAYWAKHDDNETPSTSANT